MTQVKSGPSGLPHPLEGRRPRHPHPEASQHDWELAHVRSLFAEFKWRVEHLDEDDDLQLTRDQATIEASGNDLMHAVNLLLAALSETNTGGNFDGATSAVL